MNHEHATLHLAILGKRELYHYTAKNYVTGKVENGWLQHDELLNRAEELNNQGYTFWVSINQKEYNNDSIEGVFELADFTFDIDREGKHDRPATKEELQEPLERAQKLKGYIENEYTAEGYIANSGNGFHIHFPLPNSPISLEDRSTVNEKVRKFAKKVAATQGVKIDHTYDISRRLTLIGTLNCKYPDAYKQTSFHANHLLNGLDAALADVEKSRAKNETLLKAILETQIEKNNIDISGITTIKDHPKLDALLEQDQKLKALYNGNIGDYKSRSEAEMSLICTLVSQGFTQDEIQAAMYGCKIGKWQQAGTQYQNHTLKRAFELIATSKAKAEQEKQLLIKLGSPTEKETAAGAIEAILEDEIAKTAGVNIESTADLNPADIANAIINVYPIITDAKTKITYFYISKKGIYTNNGEVILEVIIDKIPNRINRTRIMKEVIGLVKTKTYSEITPSKLIAVENGLLDINTSSLMPFTPSEFVTNSLNVKYDKDAQSPLWLKFIDEVCPDDKELLQEWSGYLLVKGYPFHAIMWFYGPTGRNGKGAWARTMAGILGESNYTSVSIAEFDGKHRFALYKLYQSLFNICSEPRTDKPLTIELLQMLTGADPIDAEIKGVQKTQRFYNQAKITVMGNKFPKVIKPTDAFWERLKLCKFPNRFVGENQIQDIERQWLDDPVQKSAILNWMLEGWQRLKRNRGFTSTQTQQATIIQFKRASDSIGAFIDEILQFEQKHTPKIAAFEAYKAYCDALGIANENDRDFNERIRNTPRIKDTSTRIQGKKTKTWLGFTLKPLPDDLKPIGEDEEDKPTGQQQLGVTGTTGTTGTTSIPRQKNSDLDYDNNKEDIAVQKAVPTVPTVPTKPPEVQSVEQETLPEHHCSIECDNFRRAACPARSNFYRALDAERPLHCIDFKPKQAEAGQ